MATTLTGITQVVITRNDGTTLTITVDPGQNLQAVVFDREAAKHCPGQPGKWPPAGVHFSGAATTASTDPALATADSSAKTGGGTVSPMDGTTSGNCYLVNGVMYCPPTQG